MERPSTTEAVSSERTLHQTLHQSLAAAAVLVQTGGHCHGSTSPLKASQASQAPRASAAVPRSNDSAARKQSLLDTPPTQPAAKSAGPDRVLSVYQGRRQAEACHERRLNTTPCGLFARTTPAASQSGGTVLRRFHKLMEDRATPGYASVPGHASLRGKCPSSPAFTPVSTCTSLHGGSTGVNSRAVLVNKWNEKLDQKLLQEIHHGLHLALLGVPPPSAERPWPPVHARAGAPDESICIFNLYCELQAAAEQAARAARRKRLSPEEYAWGGDNAEEERDTQAPEEEPFPPIPWPFFLNWIEHHQDYADDPVSAHTYMAFGESMNKWIRTKATPEQREHGVTVPLVFKLLWPQTTCGDLADFYGMCCRQEIHQIAVQPPHMMSMSSRKEFERLFRLMDSTDRGYLTPMDIANPPGPIGPSTVSERCVKNSIGSGNIYLPQFLELVCEDDHIAHEDARSAVLRDGRYLRRHTRDAVGIDIWTLRNPPASAARVYRRVEALEAEVHFWSQCVSDSPAF